MKPARPPQKKTAQKPQKAPPTIRALAGSQRYEVSTTKLILDAMLAAPGREVGVSEMKATTGRGPTLVHQSFQTLLKRGYVEANHRGRWLYKLTELGRNEGASFEAGKQAKSDKQKVWIYRRPMLMAALGVLIQQGASPISKKQLCTQAGIPDGTTRRILAEAIEHDLVAEYASEGAETKYALTEQGRDRAKALLAAPKRKPSSARLEHTARYSYLVTLHPADPKHLEQLQELLRELESNPGIELQLLTGENPAN